MRIGVNLIPLRPGQMGGAEVYFRDLLAELVALGGHEYVLVTADYNHDTLPGDTAACQRRLFVREGAGPRRRLHQIARAVGPVTRRLGRLRQWYTARAAGSLQKLIRRERLDLWFCPFTNLDPRVTPVPAVITVYDLQHEHYPEFFDAQELAHRRRFYPESCRAADHVIAISRFTRASLVERYGVEPGRATALWLAAGSDFEWQTARARVAAVRERYGLPPRYAFYPANTWHHKNHRRLVEALARHRAQSGDNLALVLTGAPREGEPALAEAIAACGLTGHVRALGYVPRSDLPALYAGATCLVFPSLFEGFGLPLVEAMLVGCPIAAANVTSVPEVVGDAAELFDPTDVSDIARALGAVAGSPERAATLAERGRARVQLFSAARLAQRTLEVFKAAAAAGCGEGWGAEPIIVDGVYDDQWVGTEATVSVRGREAVALDLDGDLPDVPALLPQQLTVSIAGRVGIVSALTSPGPFTVTVPLPANGSRRWDVSIVPLRTFRPRDHAMSDDTRWLAVRMSRVRVRTADGGVIIKVLGSTNAR